MPFLMESRDVFCDRKKIEADLLAENNNWMVKVGFGLATPGHVMAIPKPHFDCLADVPDELFDEYDTLIHPALQDYISSQFSKPFSVEYGIFGQTVKHAHIHYIPLKGEGYSLRSIVEEILFKKEVTLKRCDRQIIREVRRTARRYNLLIESGESFICPVPENILPEEADLI